MKPSLPAWHFRLKLGEGKSRKESTVLDTGCMRSWLARRRWLKAGTVLRALQRLASLAGRTGARRKESNYDRLQEVLNNLDRM